MHRDLGWMQKHYHWVGCLAWCRSLSLRAACCACASLSGERPSCTYLDDGACFEYGDAATNARAASQGGAWNGTREPDGLVWGARPETISELLHKRMGQSGFVCKTAEDRATGPATKLRIRAISAWESQQLPSAAMPDARCHCPPGACAMHTLLLPTPAPSPNPSNPFTGWWVCRRPPLLP